MSNQKEIQVSNENQDVVNLAVNAADPVLTPDVFELNVEERDAIEHEKHHYEDARAASIEALKIVQKQRGWVPDGAIHAIAEVL
ncbi:MAG: NADH-quinone oxidoreductase, subunit, partial [Pseudomonadota bacterium]